MIFCAMVCTLLAGCGSIGEPLYPALKIPSRVTDLAVVERGSNLDIRFTIPPLTTEGLPLKAIGEVDLRVGPNPTPNGWNPDEWSSRATSVNVPLPQGPGSVEAAIPVDKFVGIEVIVAVRVTNPRGRDAGWSDYKIVNVEPPLPAPTNFHVAADPKGVALTWAATGPSQFRIFRQAGPGKTEQQEKPALLATSNETNYIDISAEFGKTYQYFIQAVRGSVESNLVGPETITPKDVFPPSVPTGLTASLGVGTVELAWNRNTESDLKEYRVLRSQEGGPFAEIARGLDGPTYSDHAVESGKRYRYQVLAVDEKGLPSAPSAPVEIAVP